jgi:hypothetical protein
MGVKESLTSGFSREVVIVIVLLAQVGLWVWAFGKVPIPGEHGFVFKSQLAAETQTIVGQRVDELKRESRETAKKVDNIKVALDQILADYYSKRIKDAVRQRCKLHPLETAERDRLWDQINRDVTLYKMYSGDTEYIRPTCSEV